MTSGGKAAGRNHLTVGQYVEGILAGDRTTLARAITLVESQNADDMLAAGNVLTKILPRTGGANRIGVSGVPGVGKSTFIDSFGTFLIEQGHQVAVLAVDPSSAISGGSILGDKNRMPRLSTNARAFVRPSPNALTPGGVGWRTREAMLICEAAGYDVVLVETVGVGQSEFLVSEMVDFLMVLLLAGAGDELQGIKKGILELADLLAVNKADGENHARALQAQQEFQAALRYLPSPQKDWNTPVLAVSGLTGDGLPDLWHLILKHREIAQSTGDFDARRREQNKHWMWSLIEENLRYHFKKHGLVRQRLPGIEASVVEGETSPSQAAQDLIELFMNEESAD